MKFYKYHALGNDYIVLDPNDFGSELNETLIKRICHRNFGIGADGILYGPTKSTEADFAIRIFNPDGSEAEKSGNGLRIFARYLWDRGKVRQPRFTIQTPGGIVKATVHENPKKVTVDMGMVSFNSAEIPITGPKREVLNEKMQIRQEKLTFCAATIGNPHCVILCENVSDDLARKLGPLIENDPRFPNRTNVQFMQVMDRADIRIEIWERSAGYTLASGSSASAAAAVARRLNLCDPKIKVHMPGGHIDITVSDEFSIKMTGPVTKIAEGIISREIFDSRH